MFQNLQLPWPNIVDLYEAGKVRRWHTMRAVDPQTNADHSWGVAFLILLQWPDASANLIKAALFHDLGERWAGDIPGPAKLANHSLSLASKASEKSYFESLGFEMPELTQDEKTKLTIADRQEAWMHLNMGAASKDIDNAMANLQNDVQAIFAAQEMGGRA